MELFSSVSLGLLNIAHVLNEQHRKLYLRKGLGESLARLATPFLCILTQFIVATWRHHMGITAFLLDRGSRRKY